jgi:hypothetical protein
MSREEIAHLSFKNRTNEESGRLKAYFHSVTWQERLRIANYLNSIAYNYPEDQPPKMDRTVFRMTKQS